MIRRIVVATLAAGAVGVVAGYVYDWWAETRFEMFTGPVRWIDPEWIRQGVCICIPGALADFDPDEWCPVHGDPDLGSLVVND